MFMGWCISTDVEDDGVVSGKRKCSATKTAKNNPNQNVSVTTAASAAVNCVVDTIAKIATNFSYVVKRFKKKKVNRKHVVRTKEPVHLPEASSSAEARSGKYTKSVADHAKSCFSEMKKEGKGNEVNMKFVERLPFLTNVKKNDKTCASTAELGMTMNTRIGDKTNSIVVASNTIDEFSDGHVSVDQMDRNVSTTSHLESMIQKRVIAGFSIYGELGSTVDNQNNFRASTGYVDTSTTIISPDHGVSPRAANENNGFRFESVIGSTDVQQVTPLINDNTVDVGNWSIQPHDHVHAMYIDSSQQNSSIDNSNSMEFSQHATMDASDDYDDMDDLLNEGREMYEAEASRFESWREIPPSGSTTYPCGDICPLWETVTPIDGKPQYLALPTVVFPPIPPTPAPLSMRVNYCGVEFEELSE